MKNKRSKILGLLLALALVLPLVACGNSGGNTAPASSTPDPGNSGTSKPDTSAEPTTEDIDYPTKSIKIIVPNAPGGASDVTARAVAKFSEKYLGVSMVLENREGGGATVAHTYFKSVANDGYTLIVYGNSGTVTAPLLQTVEYDPFVDEEGISRVTNMGKAFIARTDAPFQTFEEFINYAQEHPGLKLSTTGANSIDEMICIMMNMNYDTNVVPVAYDSGGEATLAVLSGECDITCNGVASALSQIEAGELRILASACDVGLPAFPEVKTCRELGYDICLNNSVGFAVPKGTDPAIKAKLEKFFEDVCNDPEFIQTMYDLGYGADYLNMEDFYASTQEDVATVKRVLEANA